MQPVSKKLKKQLDNAFQEAFTEVLNEYFPGRFDSAPDFWMKEDKEAFDLLSELQHRTETKVMTLLGYPPEEIPKDVTSQECMLMSEQSLAKLWNGDNEIC